jgi:GNAT superfamily N-acetyltransferase
MTAEPWPTTLPVRCVRIARPTDQLDAVVSFYRDGLGLRELDRFAGHAGYRGVMLGLPGMRYHLEFTQHDDGSPGSAPSRDNLLVLYFDDLTQVERVVTRLARLGHQPVEPENPYWAENGAVTVEDPDRWRVVLMPQSPVRPVETQAVIRPGVLADLAEASEIYRSASLSNAGDRDNLLAHREYLALAPDGLAEGRTYVAERGGSLVGFATWSEAGGSYELEDLFVEPAWMRHGIASALVDRIVGVLRMQGVQRLEVTANPHALAFYRAAGFTDCGTAETAFGAATRMALEIQP